MSKRKRIVVTQADIDGGVRGDYCECPVARAVRRAFRARQERPVVVPTSDAAGEWVKYSDLASILTGAQEEGQSTKS